MDGVEPDLPECTARYLIDHLFDIGPTLPTGMGSAGLMHSEIEAWQRNTGIDLDVWECRTLRRLSHAYAGQAMKSHARECPPPYTPGEQSEDRRQAVENKLRSFLGSSRVKTDVSRTT